MFCNNCGTKVADGANNCPVCGAALPVQPPVAPVQPGAPVNFDMEKTIMADTVAPTAPVAPPAAPVAAPVAPPAAPVAPPVAPVAPQMPAAPAYAYAAPQPPKKKKTGLIIGIVVAVIAVAAIVVGVLFATGVIGGKDEEDDEPETTASEQVEDVTKESSEDETEKGAEEKTEAPVEETTDPFAGIVSPSNPAIRPPEIVTFVSPEPFTFETPTIVVDNPSINNGSAADKLAIQNAATEFIDAMSDVEPARIKNSMSAYIHAQVESMGSDPEVQNVLNAMGADLSDPSNLYIFYAIGVFNNLGDVEKIDAVAVTSVSTTFPPSTQEELDALETMYGSGLTNPPQITDAAYSTVTVSILNTDGTTSSGTVDLMLFKENGQWKVFGTM